MKVAITLLALLVVSSGYLINESFAEISEYHPFLLEGSGFAVTEESIKISEINLGLSSQLQHGSTIDFLTEDGFVTLDNEEFLISNLEGKFLREGRFIRISGDIESTNGLDTSISFFGRLVEESKDASVYGFTGRITTSDETYKIIYTTKLSTISKITTTSSEESNDLTIHIIEGASFKGGASTYLDTGNPFEPLNYFSEDRIAIEPGTTITIVNDDIVSHKIISGLEHRSRDNPYSPDGRIDSGEITPGESVSITFDDTQGFYRLYDPDYTWIGITAYVFHNTDSVVLGQGDNLGN